ncbi:MAG: hypothetical protein DHS20C16_25630 [Phycisphaerae bacterium]|nr:MAG: hypothetical protein DHS20C16_25630 [Phycisphaerae bacterium]
MVAKTVEALPKPLSEYFEPMKDALAERATEPSGLWKRDSRFKSRAQWQYIYLDAAAQDTSQSTRLRVAEAFPTDQAIARGLMRKHDVKRGGELPWALESLTQELVHAFETRNRDEIVKHTAHVIALSTFAADPFRVSRNCRGEETGNVTFGLKEMGDPLFAHQDVAQRYGWELMRRYQHRYQSEIKVSEFQYPLGHDVLAIVFETMLASLDDLDDFCDADRRILKKMKIDDGAAFLAKQDEYYELLDAEQGDAVVEMLKRATRLAVPLIYHAYKKAGSPNLSAPVPAVPLSALPKTDTDTPTTNSSATDSGGKEDPQSATTSTATIRIASKNSKVFHKPTCSHVKRISAKNRVEYEDQEAAKRSGKRHCRSCHDDNES